MKTRFDLDDVIRLMGADQVKNPKWLNLPDGYSRYYCARAPKFTYYFGMLENLDCHLIKIDREFNGW